MKKTMKLAIAVLCAALTVALVIACASGGGAKASTELGGEGVLATGEWGVFLDHDPPNNGSSTAEIVEVDEVIDGQTVKVFKITGNVTTQYQYGFAGWKIDPDDATFTKFKSATGFSFKVFGDGKRYAIKYKTSDCEMDYCYYEYGFNTEPGEWVTIEVPMKMFMQPSWGQWRKLNQQNVTGIEWQTHENWRKSATLNPFEVKFYDFKVY